MDWKSNARYNQDVSHGSIFEAKIKECRIVIHKIHGLGDEYYLSCPDFSIDSRSLETDDFDEAVNKSEKIIKERLSCLQAAINSFFENEGNNIVRY